MRANFGRVTNAMKRDVHNTALSENWNCVSVIGYEKRDKIAFVEFSDTMENAYQNPHKVTTSQLTSGAHAWYQADAEADTDDFADAETDAGAYSAATGSSGITYASRLVVDPACDAGANEK